MPYIIAKPSYMENAASDTLTKIMMPPSRKNNMALHPNTTDTQALFHALSTALPTSVHTDKSTNVSDIMDVRPMALTIEQSTNIYTLLANAPDIQRLWALGTIAHISFHFQSFPFSDAPIFRIAVQPTGNDQRVLNLTDAEYAQLVAALPHPPVTVENADEIAYIDINLDQQDTILTTLANDSNDLPNFYEDLRAFFDEATKFNRTQFNVFPD